MKIIKLKVKTEKDSYPILIGKNLITNLPKLFKENSINLKRCLIVIDKNVPNKFVTKIKKSFNNKVNIFYIFANEKNKNQKTVNSILEILLKKNFSREDYLIALGGGITGDIVGYAASQFKRGLHFINIPTTLLSQVDSAIGGKTGINTKYGKNMIGSFYQPKIVISDSIFLSTLPKREIICGYGEILKHSIILNKKFFNFLDKKVDAILNLQSPYIEKAIFESCKIKKKVVEQDEKEKSLRKILNFGHTFGHAFEATLKYSSRLNHGEAVLLGMKTALNFSFKKNFLNKKDYLSIIGHLRNSKFPFNLKTYFSLKDLNKIIIFMTKDKKNNSNKINLVLLKNIGRTLIGNNFKKKDLEIFMKRELTN